LKPENLDSEELINFIDKLLNKTGAIALDYFRQSRNLSLKGDQSPVTQADREIETLIRSTIQETFPTHSIIGEEFEDQHNDSEFTWIVDPIDGTRSFIAGKHDFGTLIGLKQGQNLIGGVIDCPALNERWISFNDNLTTVNGIKAVCHSVDMLEDALMATTSSHEFGMKKWKAYLLLEDSVKVTTTGSDCYNYGLLASGYLDLVAERLSAPHDYLPLIKIVEGAGGVITDWDGNELIDNQNNVYVLASASKELHQLALNKLIEKI
jgi:inositol-phosphate phosphatase/L-galactose 1-phosphate phosphatase/histidinol-phosphatase